MEDCRLKLFKNTVAADGLRRLEGPANRREKDGAD